MPTYEYLCESCGNRYEKREGFDARARQKCPKCGKQANRVLFAPPIVFKGSGFYKTDNRGTSSAVADEGASPAKSDSTTTTAADGGHSHGPGGHSHDTPTPAPTPAAKPDSAPETAAAT